MVLRNQVNLNPSISHGGDRGGNKVDELKVR